MIFLTRLAKIILLMKNRLTLLLLVSLISIGVFGFIALGHQGCLATIVSGNACTQSNNPLDESIFHSQMFKSFSLAILSLFLALLIGLRLTAIAGPTADSPKPTGRHCRPNAGADFYALTRMKFNRWLSLCEKRDPALLTLSFC